jgi:hypothetical protein
MASSAHDVNFIRTNRPDPLVKGFAEEERDEKARRKRAQAANQSSWGTKQDSEYRFSSIKAEFKYSTPPPYEAEKLLQKLATDPGVIDIMKSRGFKVGILTEMSPVEAQERMANRGTPNMDLLGYNQNSGEMIVLRLRTDSLKGFRPYHDLINTLIHELTHNVWGPHDNNFWRLYGELKAQYMRFHSFWSHGGRTANGTEQFQGFASGVNDMEDESKSGGLVLGGAAQLGGSAASNGGDIRTLAAKAAEARLASTATTIGPNAAAATLDAITTGAPKPPPALQSLGLPNFLSGDGKWKIMCPCGQTHDFDGMCDDVAAVSSVDAAGTEVEPVAMDCGPVEAVDTSVSCPSIGEEDAAPVPMECDSNDAGATPLEALAPSNPEDSAAEAVVATQSSYPASETADATIGIDELAAAGLDGASVWLNHFENKLKTLGEGSHNTSQRIAAMRLLLRLVENIVRSPGEQKFRRVRADNPRIRTALLEAGAEVEGLMTLLGFESSEDANERVFILRDATFDTVRLRMGQEILQREVATVEGLTVR